MLEFLAWKTLNWLTGMIKGTSNLYKCRMYSSKEMASRTRGLESSFLYSVTLNLTSQTAEVTVVVAVAGRKCFDIRNVCLWVLQFLSDRVPKVLAPWARISWNVWYPLPCDAVSHLRRTYTWVTPLWKTKKNCRFLKQKRVWRSWTRRTQCCRGGGSIGRCTAGSAFSWTLSIERQTAL
jgi:hypothetical protein